MAISKPNYPSIDPYYKYLASVGFAEGGLWGFCIEKAVVTGLSSLTGVNIDIDGDLFKDVPVWIHTDVGTRAALYNKNDRDNPEDYFANAALLFPVPAGVSLLDPITEAETVSIDPECYVITTVVNGELSAIAVIGVVDSVVELQDKYETPNPTWGLYLYFKAELKIPLYTQPRETLYIVYDLVRDKIATAPVYDEYGNIEEFKDCIAVVSDVYELDESLPQDLRPISSAIAKGYKLENEVTGSSSLYGDIGYFYCVNTYGNTDPVTCPCTIEGESYTIPGWSLSSEVVTSGIDYTTTGVGQCYGGYYERDYLYETEYSSYIDFARETVRISESVETLGLHLSEGWQPDMSSNTTYDEFGVRYVFRSGTSDPTSIVNFPQNFCSSGTISFSNGANITWENSGSLDDSLIWSSDNLTRRLGFNGTFRKYTWDGVATYSYSENISFSYNGKTVTATISLEAETTDYRLWDYPNFISSNATDLTKSDIENIHYEYYAINKCVLHAAEENNFICKLFLHHPMTWYRKTVTDTEIDRSTGTTGTEAETIEEDVTYIEHEAMYAIGEGSAIQSTNIVEKIQDAIASLNLPFQRIWYAESNIYLVPRNVKVEAARQAVEH